MYFTQHVTPPQIKNQLYLPNTPTYVHPIKNGLKKQKWLIFISKTQTAILIWGLAVGKVPLALPSLSSAKIHSPTLLINKNYKRLKIL